MIWAAALAAGALVASGVFLTLARDALRVVIGISLVSAGANLVVLGAGRFDSGQPAFIAAGASVLAEGTANPLPQALVLTAIVIGFSLTCFALALVLALQHRFTTTDVAQLTAADPPIGADGLPPVWTMPPDLVHALVAAPVLVPLATAIGAGLAGAPPRRQTAIGLAGATTLLAVSVALLWAVVRDGALRTGFGGWEAPFAIGFVADPLGAGFVVVAAVMGLAALVFQHGRVAAAPASPLLVPLVHAFLAGTCGAFLTADLFNLYVWFEVVLVASLGLLSMGGERRPLDAALRYFVLNVIGTVLVLMGVAQIYAVTGYLDFAMVGEVTRSMGARPILPATALLLVGLLFKAAAFPLSAWLPATYHTLRAPVLALFAALGTKVGVYALLRVHGGVLDVASPFTSEALGWLAVVTMVTGVLGAAHHWDIRRILAFHSVSQVGYMLLGVALDSPGGTAAAFVFAVHHSFIKGNLFFIAAIARASAGSYDLRNIGGLRAARPWLGVLFLSQALALVGIPR